MVSETKKFTLKGGPHDGQDVHLTNCGVAVGGGGPKMIPMSRLIDGNWHISQYVKHGDAYVFEKTDISAAERVE